MEHFRALLAVDAVDFADLYTDVGNMLSEQRHFDEVGFLSTASHTVFKQLCLFDNQGCLA